MILRIYNVHIFTVIAWCLFYICVFKYALRSIITEHTCCVLSGLISEEDFVQSLQKWANSVLTVRFRFVFTAVYQVSHFLRLLSV